MRRLLASALLFLGAAAANAATIQLSPGQNIQAAVNANPVNTTFVFKPGVYREQSIVPKDGMVFDGQGVASLAGAKKITQWTHSGATWYATGQTQQGLVRGECQDDFPRCNRPDDVSLQHKPLRHVGTLAEVGPGKFFFDYNADRIYIGDDPTGKVVEAATKPFAFSGGAAGVTIKNLTIRNYATPIQDGVVTSKDGAVGWIVDNNIITKNHSIAVDAGANWRVTNNKLNQNGMAGYGAGGNGFVFEDNEIGGNNYAGVDYEWEGGGGKATDSASGGVFRSNCVHGNDGPGIWLDENANGTLVESNYVFGNTGAGIMFEISVGATIRNNTVFNNGSNAKGWFWDPQILISSARNADVSGNVVDTPAGYGNAITIVSQDRAPFTPATGNNVHGNTVTIRSNPSGGFGRLGAVTDVDSDINAVASGNTMSGNTYHLASAAGDYWNWKDADRTLGQMKTLGQETGSTADATLGAAPALTCP